MIGMGFNFQAGFSTSIIQRAMLMAQSGVALSASVNVSGMSMGMMMGVGGLDMATFSSEAFMGGPSGFFHPLMGMGGYGRPAVGMAFGMGMVPGMGSSCCGPGGVQDRLMKMMMMLLLMMMLKQMMDQMGRQAMGGMPFGGLRMGMGMMMGVGMPMANRGMPMMGGVGMVGGLMPPRPMQGPIELRRGQTYTTPGGCTISWKGNTVTITEPGGRQRQIGGMMMGAAAGASMGAVAFAGAFAGNGYAGAFAGAMVGIGGCCGAGIGMIGGAGRYRRPAKWKVWGDPHIKDAAGKQQDFKTNNALFTLQDGTRVAMAAAGPRGVVQRVRIFPPNCPVNRRTLGGIDPRKTTVYYNRGLRKVAGPTLDKFLGVPGFNFSPFGNMMFGFV